jgi:tetratricopeptide (TPR) repeat protein
MNLYTHVQQTLQDRYVAFVSYSKKKYVKESLIAAAALVFAVGGYAAFGWYQKRQNIQAFAGLVEISKAYEAALAKSRELQNKPAEEQTENPWEDTQLLLEAIASTHASSSLSPFFVIYQAQLALDADGDFDKACKLMEQGLRRLSKKSPFYDMFNVKRIKMLLDSPMQDVREKAIKDLEQVAAQKDNYYAQEALWTLGSYQAFYGNMDQAIAAWKTLAQESSSNKDLINSPWVSQAQEKLKTLNISLSENN